MSACPVSGNRRRSIAYLGHPSESGEGGVAPIAVNDATAQLRRALGAGALIR
jgi:hypothetical protein